MIAKTTTLRMLLGLVRPTAGNNNLLIGEVMSYRSLYLRSRHADPATLAAATIPVERILRVITIAGREDQVWPSDLHAENIRSRRAEHGMQTTAVTDDEAGHRTVLPGEPVVADGIRMRRGGTETADRRLGQLAWAEMIQLLVGGLPTLKIDGEHSC